MDLPIIKSHSSSSSDNQWSSGIATNYGGSLPLYLFEKLLKVNTISVPIANHDNNQHAENENILTSKLVWRDRNYGVINVNGISLRSRLALFKTM
jgi:hypothetical protein